MATIFGPDLRINSDKDPSDCNSFQLFLLSDFFGLLGQLILDSVLVSAPGLGRLGSCAVCSGPQLYSRQPAHSLTSQKHPTLKNDPTFCVASFSPRQNDRHAVVKSVKRWNRSVESCPIVLVCVLSDWQDCQVPLTNHLLPFRLGEPSEKSDLGERVWKPVGAECCVGSLPQWRGLPPEEWPGNLTRGNNCVLVYCRKKKEGVYLKM